MLNQPSVDEMIRKLGTEEQPISRFALCAVASKRARQIIETNKNIAPSDRENTSELSRACEDISAGKVVIGKD